MFDITTNTFSILEIHHKYSSFTSINICSNLCSMVRLVGLSHFGHYNVQIL